MPDSDHAADFPSVPLFPLPNVVLFPKAVLPLHIFEERYKQMTADALEGERLIAMSLLLPGWEKDYHCKPAIEPVVCVGKILTSEKLGDGKYNFLLQGICRARIVREHEGRPYRTATLRKLPEPAVMEIDLAQERQRLAEQVSAGPLAGSPLGIQFAKLFERPIPTVHLMDLMAFTFVEDIRAKQRLLAETDPHRRSALLIDSLAGLSVAPPRGWASFCPSMN